VRGKVIHTVGDQVELIMFCDEEPENKGSHCGACQMMQGPNAKTTDTVMAKNSIGAKVGQIVQLELQEYAELKSTMILLVIPLLIFLISLGVTDSMQLPILDSALISGGALIIIYIVIKRLTKNKTYFYLVEEKTHG